MSRQSFALRQVLALTTAIGLVAPAFAQDAAPPGRVGQVAGISGSVSYNGAGSNGQWVAATENYPVSTGDSLFTQDGAQAAVVVDASRLTLGPNTELQITALDNQNFTATESQGEVFLNLNALQQGQNFTVNTPRGAISINQPGEYDILAGDATDPTTISVLAGAARIGSLDIPAGQAGYLAGTDQTTAQSGPIQNDAFMNNMLAQMAPPPPPYAPPVVEQMTGVSELSNYGDWDSSPQYGAIWYPNVDADWAPYREGNWAYVVPWGWTWVDVEPWGFAPFHYGRWIHDGPRWGWVPAGAYEHGEDRPIYAPALVGFFGVGALTAAAFASGSIGWVPLGPNEAYYPGYHTDPDYLRRLNRPDVRNFNGGPGPMGFAHYANHGAATYIPAGAMARGENVRHFGHPVPPDMFGQARPVQGDFNRQLRPNFQPRAASAPAQNNFTQRRNPPPAEISHQPMQPGGNFHPQGQNFAPNRPQAPGQSPFAHVQQPGQPPVQPRPEFSPQNQPVRPQGMPQVIGPQFNRPQEQARPQMPQVIRPRQPAETFHPQPQAPQFRPQAEQPRPAAPQFHPQQAPQFHPQGASRPPEPHGQEAHAAQHP